MAPLHHEPPLSGTIRAAGYWRTLTISHREPVCMVFSSTPYSEDDYVRDYEEFIAFKQSK